MKAKTFKIEDIDATSSDQSMEDDGPPKRFHIKRKAMIYFGLTDEDLYLKVGEQRPYVNHIEANINLAKNQHLLKQLAWLNDISRREEDQQLVA